MLAVILMLLLPVVLIWVARSYSKDRPFSKGEWILRYVIYFGLLLFASNIILSFMKDDNTSFFDKISQSPAFAIKFIALEVIMCAGMLAAEWLLVKKRIGFRMDWELLCSNKVVSLLQKYVCPFLIYILAAVIIVLNIRLMFDNVVWGDEAFSANTAQKTMFGIMQVLYYWDNHPPLHYYWTKLFGEILGHTVPVYHLASLVPFLGGIVLAVTSFRKRFGNIPAAFFVVISGLGSACLGYNLEIRMYSLAFFGVVATAYCSYQVISTGKRSAWIGMVFWALEAAYSHYYALVVVGILLFCTGVAVWLKKRGISWVKGVAAIGAFVLGYSPWLFFLFTALGNVSSNWWMTDILGLDRSLMMVFGGEGMSNYLLPLVLFFVIICLVTESAIFRIEDKDGAVSISLGKPSIKEWSNETYAVVVGIFTMTGTLLFAYLLCYVMKPILAERYLYPLSGLTLVMLVLAGSRALACLKKLGEAVGMNWLQTVGKAFLLLFLILFFGMGIANYTEYSAQVTDQDTKTNAVLETIGDVSEDVKMVSNGVKHLSWTVLYHYYPDNEIIEGNQDSTDAAEFWYFNPTEVGTDTLQSMESKGYNVTSYGEMQISQYPFYLYHFEK